VIGVLEMSLDAEEFRSWLDGAWFECEHSESEAAKLPRRYEPLPASSDVIVADVGQLTNDLRDELSRMLHRLLKNR
jgi:hypothetical protein